MPAGDVGGPRRRVRVLGRGVQQGSQPGERAHHVVPVHRHVQHRAEDVQQEPDVRLRGLGDLGDVPLHGFVGEADVDPAVVLGEDQDEAVGLPGHGDVQPGGERAEALRAQHEVGAAGGADADPVDEAARPHPGGVDHRAGADLALLAGQFVTDPGARRGQLQRPDAGEDPRLVRGCRTGQGRHQPGVVGEPAVPRQQAAAQPVQAQRGGEMAGLHHGEAARRREGRPGRARRQPQRVPGVEPGPGEGGLPARHQRGERQHERLGVDQMGRRALHQDAALHRALVGDVEPAGGQVAQPAVDQLAAEAGGAERQVVGVDRHHPQSARRGVQGGARAGHAQADDQHVHGVAGHRVGQVAGAPGGGQGRAAEGVMV